MECFLVEQKDWPSFTKRTETYFEQNLLWKGTVMISHFDDCDYAKSFPPFWSCRTLGNSCEGKFEVCFGTK